MTNALRDFQQDFIDAIYRADGDVVAPTMRLLVSQPGFDVYRNTIVKACIDALQANYPTVEKLVGTEWFRAAAAIHVRAAPPDDVRLYLYGRTFSAFLAGFEPARELPYLSAVAELDRLWMEVHVAADEPALMAADIADLPPLALGRTMLRPHAGARWMWFEQPACTIWRVNRENGVFDNELDWQGEGMLLVRSDGVVRWQPLSAGACAFLDACAEGQPLKSAVGYAMRADPALDISQTMSDLILAGAFAPRVPLSPFLQGSP